MARAAPGAIIGDRFELLRVAGSGGMGVVYQARDRKADRLVALKVLEQVEPSALGRFQHEVGLLAALEHPHIVGYISHGVTEAGAPYVVMPWLDGTDLEDRLGVASLTVDETLAVARGVADALAYLHGRGLIHRDLKPSNLFLPDGDVGRVQLIDLGIAREGTPTRSVTQSGVLVGTPNFIAPEQARGDKQIAPAVDVFALGCVLFECLTGKRLFTGAHLMSILAKILLEEAPRVRELRPEVPAFLDDLVDRMVAKDPEKRPADGGELVKWLSAPHATAIPPVEALTADERRVVTILVIALPSKGAPPRDGDEPFTASSRHFGVDAQVLADRIAIVRAPERLGAVDQAVLLTRFARHVQDTHPRARIAMTTGSTTTGARLPVGEAIDRAVAVVRASEGGQGVRVDDATAALIAGRFDVADGRVTSERAALDPTRRLLGKPTSCVGRERELAILEATFADCAAGEGPKVVLVTADAGVGKSRLQHELERRLRAEAPDVRVVQCRGDPLRSSTPYAMVAQAVRHAIGIGEREPLEGAKEKLRAHVASFVASADAANVADFIGELVGVPFDDEGRLPLGAARLDADAMADQIGRAFEDLVRGWCARRPVIVVLEDLHWGHATDVRLLDRALWKLTGARIFVLALARPEVHARFPALFAKRDVTELRLPPLTKRAAAKLVQEVLGSQLAADEIDRLVERSEGNAFYLEELVRAATAPAASVGAAPHHRPRDLPEALLAVAQARLERLDPNARRILRAASVFGDVFWLEGVCALVGEAPATVGPTLGALVEQEAIAPAEYPRLTGVSELTFRHAILRGTAYATLTDEDRALGHRLAAAWLRDVLEDDDIVARHWLKGGDRARAVTAFRAAAERRMQRAQHDAAARSAARALSAVDAESAAAVPICVRLLADALVVVRRIEVEDVIAGIEEHCPPFDASAPHAARSWIAHLVSTALGFLRDSESPSLFEALASAARALGALGEFATAKAWLDEATSRAGSDERAQRTLRYASARVASWSANASAMIELLDEDAFPDEPGQRHECLLMLAWAVVTVGGRDALARGLALLGQAEAIRGPRRGGLEDSNPVEDHLARVQYAKARTACFAFAGEHARSAEAADDGVLLARDAGLRFEESAQLHNAAEQYCLSGDLERSRARALASSAIAHDIGADLAQHLNDVLLAYLDRADARLRLAAETMKATGNPLLDLYGHYWLGRFLAETHAPGARPALERAHELAGRLAIRHFVEDCRRILATLEP